MGDLWTKQTVWNVCKVGVVARPISELLEQKVSATSRAEVADALGVTSQAVINWTSGIRTPRLSYRERLAAVLGVSVDEVVAAISEQGMVAMPAREPVERPVSASSSFEARLASVEAEMVEMRDVRRRLEGVLDRLEQGGARQSGRKKAVRVGR